MRGSPAKQRTVLTAFDWAAEALADWVERGLPRYGQPVNDLFPTEKGGLVPERNLWQRMRNFVDELGFPPGLDLHSIRRSYAAATANAPVAATAHAAWSPVTSSG